MAFQQIDEEILEFLDAPALEPGGVVTAQNLAMAKSKRCTRFRIGYDPDQPLNAAFFTLKRRVENEVGRWSVRLEFSPATAGQAGLERIAEGVKEIGILDLGRLLRDLCISRLDAAVDCIGVEPIDLIAHAPKIGKRQVWFGDNGRPASIYLFAKKAPPTKAASTKSVRTFGPQRLTLYERRSYFRQLGIEPPFGDAPVTRIEISRRWKKLRPPLASLGEIPNLLEGRRVAYAGAVETSKPADWAKFCVAALGAGPEAAQWLFLPGAGAKLRQAYMNCAGDMLSDQSWSSWPLGLAQTGIDQWVALANSKAVDVAGLADD